MQRGYNNKIRGECWYGHRGGKGRGKGEGGRGLKDLEEVCLHVSDKRVGHHNPLVICCPQMFGGLILQVAPLYFKNKIFKKRVRVRQKPRPMQVCSGRLWSDARHKTCSETTCNMRVYFRTKFHTQVYGRPFRATSLKNKTCIQAHIKHLHTDKTCMRSQM